MKKLFTLLLALVATTALWAHDFEVNGIYYFILENKINEVEVTNPYLYEVDFPEYSGSVIIPSSVTYNGTTYSVTSIRTYAFMDCSGLTSITIPNSVTYMGACVFKNCSSLTSVTIPNSVTSIGLQVFQNCSSLTSVTIPNSVTYIGGAAFSGCSTLTSITIPNSVTEIQSSAFNNCSSLRSITIPSSVSSIGKWAFSGCRSLRSITIPNSVTSIGEEAFDDCSGLTQVVWNAKNCADFSSASYPPFYNISSQITSFTFGDCVKHVPAYLCHGMSKLTSITIPNSVTSIGDRAFYECTGLTSITSLAEIPPTLGYYAFYNVSTQIPVYVPCGRVSAYKTANGWKVFDNIREPLAEYSIIVSTSNNQMGTAIVDYNTICGNQISATANHGYHFVQWSDGNTDNPRTLELTQDTILTAEFVQLFSGQCGDNLYWDYDEASKKISITGSGDMYDYTKSTQPWYLFQEQITELVISPTTTSIGTSAFSGCSGLTSITIPNSVTSIGEGAFEGCSNLVKASLGYSMETIGKYAFAECRKLIHTYCYAVDPPYAYANSFANYNGYLYAPCENQRDYILDMVWGDFKFIECIGAESDETGSYDVTVTPGSNDVTITWPTEDEADTYSIVITKDGEVFCTLTFNSNGQLVSIAFAPGRQGHHPAQYAEAVANGYRFTVTGLDEGTKYGYNLDVKDDSNKTIKSYNGEFTTESATAVDNINSSSSDTQKLIRDGQLLIIRDGKTYNAQGAAL